MSRDCAFHADALAGLAGGRLDPRREARVREHLASCAACRDDLAVLTAIARAEAAPPAGLEARIRDAVRQAAGSAAGPAGGALGISRRRPGARWRPWSLPLAAAAALALAWVGLVDRSEPAAEDAATLAAAYAPYGAWPAEGPEVAGAPVLAELSAEDLELLLHRMDP